MDMKASLQLRLLGLAAVLMGGGALTMRAQQALLPGGAGTGAPSSPAAAVQAPGRGGRGADQPGADFLKRPPIVRLSPEQEQQTFLLPPGYKMELVLSDPDIEDPVGVSFDGNGRMYVLEMRSYMRDAEGSNSREPVSRISRWEDTDGDGKYDKHTVFADHLVLPRIAFPLQDGVILALETDNRDLYKLSDTDGDGVADTKEVFYERYGRVQNMEWQPGGMTWALDNWLYTTYNPFRLRILPGGKIAREETDVNGGQWGNAQDNYGKVWWVDGGGETGPVTFQAPIAYGAFNLPDNFEPDFQVPWGAPGGIADMQGGMNRVRLPDGTLNHFTAAAGPAIYRGDRLPPDLVGDLLFEEPVARIVRRAKIVVTDGVTQLRNAYPKSEFIRSTDPLFRPVNMVGAPDGTLYLLDMYTGIIQDAQFVGPGSYLRRKVEQYDLHKQHNWGRIWRITYEGMEPNRTRPAMYRESAAQLVAHLEDPNGWWRDTAQKQLVLAQEKSAVPALKTMARTSANELARIHALWTLEGLNALDAVLARELLKSTVPRIRIQAVRASESLYKAGDKSLAADYRALLKDADADVVIQAMLTINLLQVPNSSALIQATADGSVVRGIHDLGTQILKGGVTQGQPAALADTGAAMLAMPTAERRVVARGEATFKELCASCHGPDGKGAPVAGAADGATLAPPLAGSTRVTGHREYIIKVLLNGLQGPIDGKTYNGGAVMVPMGANDDQWIADVASFARKSFGNSASIVTPDQVASVRKAVTGKGVWTIDTLEPTIPTLLTNSADWKFSASHNSGAAGSALSGPGARWDTGSPQEPGMWLQLELPDVTDVVEVQMDAPAPGFGRGGRGGAAPAAPGGGQVPGGAPGANAPAVPAAGPPAGPAGPAGRASGGGRGPRTSGPVSYRVEVSTDGTTWSPPVAQGTGATPTTVMTFGKSTPARFIRITQTGTAAAGEVWAVQQVRVYRAARVSR